MVVSNKTKKINKQQMAVILKSNGVPNKDIKEILFADQTPGAARVSLSRALKDNNVQYWVADAFEGVGLDVKEMLLQYKEELTAMRRMYFRGDFIEEVPDYSIRQKARYTLFQLMQAFTPAVADPIPATPVLEDIPALNAPDGALRKEFTKAVKNGDIKTIERIVFKEATQT